LRYHSRGGGQDQKLNLSGEGACVQKARVESEPKIGQAKKESNFRMPSPK